MIIMIIQWFIREVTEWANKQNNKDRLAINRVYFLHPKGIHSE